jgi:hypothetical protein
MKLPLSGYCVENEDRGTIAEEEATCKETKLPGLSMRNVLPCVISENHGFGIGWPGLSSLLLIKPLIS